MVTTIIRGHRLDGFINGLKPCPPEFISVAGAHGEEQQLSNPDFESWIIHDQLLMGWLYGSIIKGVASEVIGCRTAASLWTALQELFGAHSRAHMDDLRTKLQTTRKGSQTMSEYLRQKRVWADTLAMAGDPYPEKLLFGNVLSGLDAEYLSIVIPIERQKKLTWQELQSTLLSFDSRLERLSGGTSTGKLANSSAIFVQKSFNPGQVKRQGQGSGQNAGANFNSGRGASSYGRSRGGNPNQRGRGRNNYGNNGSKPTCQVCGKYGHSAAICYNRYDESYTGKPPNGDQDRDKQHPFQALVATPETLNDDNWYFDSGASNHLALDELKLNDKVGYDGKEKVMVGNGTKLHISHVGNCSLNTDSSAPLLL